jgi:hypothetical protein
VFPRLRGVANVPLQTPPQGGHKKLGEELSPCIGATTAPNRAKAALTACQQTGKSSNRRKAIMILLLENESRTARLGQTGETRLRLGYAFGGFRYGGGTLLLAECVQKYAKTPRQKGAKIKLYEGVTKPRRNQVR